MNEMTQQSTPNSPAPAPPQAAEWANPTPAGLVALAVACFCFFGLLTGFVGASAMPLIGCWLVGGFVVQLIVGLLDLKGKNYAGGNTFLYFGAFFMLTGGIEMFVKYNALAGGAPLDGRIDGIAWLPLTVALILWTPAFMKKFGLLSLIVLLLDVALPFITLLDLGVLGAGFKPVPAYALLLAGIIAVYLSAALIVNTTYGKKIYPTI